MKQKSPDPNLTQGLTMGFLGLFIVYSPIILMYLIDVGIGTDSPSDIIDFVFGVIPIQIHLLFSIFVFMIFYYFGDDILHFIGKNVEDGGGHF